MPDRFDLDAIEALEPRAQLLWFREHPGIHMAPSEWDRFYCSSVEHRGLHCPSCMTDEEYSGQPPRIIGYRDDGEIDVELLPAEVVTRAQTLACRKLGWDFELVPVGGEGRG